MVVFKRKEYITLNNNVPVFKTDFFETYIVERKGKKFFLDKINKCFEDIYFGVKKIKKYGVPHPKIIKVDKYKHLILKKYIEGEKPENLMIKNEFKDEYFKSLFYIYRIARANKINLCYEPENYLINDGSLFYMNYIFKVKNDDTDLEKGPIRLWLPTIEGKNHLKNLGFDTSQLIKEDEKYWNKKILLLSIQYW